ncbi:MAG: hypothetical protein A3G92_06935 [Deltaproteobacteria bacterium RIFCSPLOWO2_12_FULL_38_8]|nr:MAG: hypothetical protein A3G92_06935 [Deltaproteobacteria bacterium RIFCSPLOWO2_12_FULL_38_8]
MKKTLMLFKRVALVLGISSIAFAGGFGDHKHHSGDIVDSAGTNVDTTKFPKKDATETISGGWTLSGTNTFSGTNNFSGTFQLGGTSYTGTAANLNTLTGGAASDASTLHIHTSGTTADNSGLLDNLDSLQFLRSDANDSVTTGFTLNIDSGATLSIDGAWDIAGTAVASTLTATELNTLDGVASTLTSTELNILDGVTASAAELNKLDNAGANVTAANLDALTGSGETALHSHAAGNATTLDSIDSSQFLRSDTAATLTTTTGSINSLTLTHNTNASNNALVINPSVNLANGIYIAPSSGTITDGIDCNSGGAGGTVTNCINLSTSNIVSNGITISTAELNLLDGATTLGDITAVGDVASGAAFTATAGNDGNTLYFEGTSSDGNEIALTGGNPASDTILTLPATTDTLVGRATIDTLTNKTLTSPTIDTAPTAASATWTNLGSVTTVDINGGTIDGATIGGSSAGVGTFSTLTNSGVMFASNGSGSAPSYSFTNDTDSGLWYSGSNNIIKLSVNSSNGTSAGIALTVMDAAGTGSDGLYMDMGTATSTNTLCHTNSTGGTYSEQIIDCSAAPSDLAEWYETESGIESGDLVTTSNRFLSYQNSVPNLEKGKEKFYNPVKGASQNISILQKSTKPYEENLIGVISTMPYQLFGEDVKDAKGVKNPLPLALVGSVPVKVTTENGPLQVGDPITSSSLPGVGMKATKAGAIVGIALEPFNRAGVGKVMMYVMNKTFHTPEKTKKFVQKLSEEENQQALNDIIESKEAIKLLKDGKTLTTLRTLVSLYEGSPNKQGVSALLNVPQPILNKLSLMAQKFSRYAKEKGWFTAGKNIDSLSEEELLQFFEKAFVVEETLVVKGEIVQVMKTPQFGEIVSFAETSAEPSVSDRGEARLVNGVVTIELDPRFTQLAEVAAQNSYQVQVTPTSLDVQGVLIVAQRTPTGFTIEESGNGRSNATFSWEVTALRRSFSKEALPDFQKFQKNLLHKKDNAGQEEVKAKTKKSDKLLSWKK